jgi:hypothetical protein
MTRCERRAHDSAPRDARGVAVLRSCALCVGLLLAMVGKAQADVGFSAFAGFQCDKPAVRDGGAFDSRCSFQPVLGVGAAWPAQTAWQGALELRHSRRHFASSAFVTDTPVRAQFIDFSVLAVWRVRQRERWSVAAVGGAQLGFLVAARRRFRDIDQDVTNEFREADLQAVRGLRLSRSAGRGRMYVEGRVGWGLTDLDNTNQQQIHARTFVATLGYSR